MSEQNAWLYQHRNNVFSQGGEDGVIEKILEILPSKDQWCVEFGAMDGRHLSNSCHLIENAGYRAVLIEAATKPFRKLEASYANNPSVTTINRFVGFTAQDGLDSILRETEIPFDFDVLSVDIDGNDYHVWRAFSDYQPKVAIVEFNPTIPLGLEFVQEANPKVSKGSSLRSIVELGKEKGYELVSVVGVNAIFVAEQYFPLFNITDNSPEALWVDQRNVTHLFIGYDGEIHLIGAKSLKWHRLPINERKLQQLPGFLRNFPGNYNTFQRILFAGLLLVRNPGEFMFQFRTKVLGKPD